MNKEKSFTWRWNSVVSYGAVFGWTTQQYDECKLYWQYRCNQVDCFYHLTGSFYESKSGVKLFFTFCSSFGVSFQAPNRYVSVNWIRNSSSSLHFDDVILPKQTSYSSQFECLHSTVSIFGKKRFFVVEIWV